MHRASETVHHAAAIYWTKNLKGVTPPMLVWWFGHLEPRRTCSAERAVTEPFRGTLSAAAFYSSHGLLIADQDLLAGDTALTEVLVCPPSLDERDPLGH